MRGCVRLREHDLDPDADPLVDLDAHVNGRWRTRTSLPPHRARWDAFIALRERSLALQARIARRAASGERRDACSRVIGDLWSSGLAETVGVAELQPEFDRIAALDGPDALGRYICERQARGWPLLFTLTVAPALDSPDEHLLCLEPAAVGDAALLAAQRVLAHSGLDAGAARRGARAVAALEAELTRLRPAPDAPRDIVASQRRVPLETANQSGDVLRWPALLRAVGATAARSARSISLTEARYFTGLQALLRAAPTCDWRAWLRWQAVHSMANVLDDATATLCASRPGSLAPRWQRLLDAINAAAGDAMGALFAGSQPLRRAQVPAVHDMAAELREAFAARLRSLDWLSAAARGDALGKLAAMRFKIGAPETPADFTDCHTAPTGWLANLTAVRAFALRRALAALARPVDRDQWTLQPQTVNARYDPQRNDVTIPLALLGPPLFDARAGRAAHFGGIGAVLAHEMTHGFDARGRRFDATGRLRERWSEADGLAFTARTERLRRQLEHSGCGVDGARVLDETLADFGGLAIACDALSARGVTATEELRTFFRTWAALWRQHTSGEERERRLRLDTHAPSPLRAHAPAADLPAFHSAFGRTVAPPGGSLGVW